MLNFKHNLLWNFMNLKHDLWKLVWPFNMACHQNTQSLRVSIGAGDFISQLVSFEFLKSADVHLKRGNTHILPHTHTKTHRTWSLNSQNDAGIRLHIQKTFERIWLVPQVWWWHICRCWESQVGGGDWWCGGGGLLLLW